MNANEDVKTSFFITHANVETPVLVVSVITYIKNLWSPKMLNMFKLSALVKIARLDVASYYLYDNLSFIYKNAIFID